MTETSRQQSRRRFRWAMILQLAVVGHAIAGVIYASMKMPLYTGIVLLVTVVLSFVAISIAFDAGTYWPNGCRRCNDADA